MFSTFVRRALAANHFAPVSSSPVKSLTPRKIRSGLDVAVVVGSSIVSVEVALSTGYYIKRNGDEFSKFAIQGGQYWMDNCVC